VPPLPNFVNQSWVKRSCEHCIETNRLIDPSLNGSSTSPPVEARTVWRSPAPPAATAAAPRHPADAVDAALAGKAAVHCPPARRQ
jgi:hypothetical protein